jgi:hypothetical protein
MLSEHANVSSSRYQQITSQPGTEYHQQTGRPLTADPLEDVWATRDFLVLREATRMIDNGDNPTLNALAEAAGLDLGTTARAIRALERRGLVTPDERLSGVAGVEAVSGEAYLLTGLHPNGDDAVTQLISALRQAAEHEADPDERSRLRKLADNAGGVSRDVLANVLATVITAAGRGLMG